MSSPQQRLQPDIEALSGILGSISIACWVVVFTPQILENFRRSSASGLSLLFLIAWLVGDVFNILGAVFQSVLPTMTILAVYYTSADLALLAQCLYYRGFALSDTLQPEGDTQKKHKSSTNAVIIDGEEEGEEVDEESPLLNRANSPARFMTPAAVEHIGRRGSGSSLGSSFRDALTAVDGTHLSPATPLLPTSKSPISKSSPKNQPQTSTLLAFLYNTAALTVVCLAGALGWWLSAQQSVASHNTSNGAQELSLDPWGQAFGYLCAVLYLGSRIPQLLLNHKRKSTEGVSMLFFLFACVGNLTYVLSIFAYEPPCAKIDGQWLGGDVGMRNKGCADDRQWGREYGWWLLVNLSWLIGSAGTLLLDLGIFVQFWMYRGRGADTGATAAAGQG